MIKCLFKKILLMFRIILQLKIFTNICIQNFFFLFVMSFRIFIHRLNKNCSKKSKKVLQINIIINKKSIFIFCIIALREEYFC